MCTISQGKKEQISEYKRIYVKLHKSLTWTNFGISHHEKKIEEKNSESQINFPIDLKRFYFSIYKIQFLKMFLKFINLAEFRFAWHSIISQRQRDL